MRNAIAIMAIGITAAMASCPNNCNGRGRCGQDDRCTCWRGFQGPDCGERICKFGVSWTEGVNEVDSHNFEECSNQGDCDRSSGLCSCYSGFEGAACERMSCPNDCSGHGRCKLLKELDSSYDVELWDADKIQGCMCDPGYVGQDCSSRICPYGDDPLTVPSSLVGDTWQVRMFNSSNAVSKGEFHLEITTLDNVTVRSRPINGSVDLNSAGIGEAAADSDTDTFERALLLTGLIHDVQDVSIFVASAANQTANIFEFTLVDPLRLKGINVVYADNCHVAGCQPRRMEQDPESAIAGMDAIVSSRADADAESAICSNRGTCDWSSGQCQCFEGHAGLACELQTVLV